MKPCFFARSSTDSAWAPASEATVTAAALKSATPTSDARRVKFLPADIGEPPSLSDGPLHPRPDCRRECQPAAQIASRCIHLFWTQHEILRILFHQYFDPGS